MKNYVLPLLAFCAVTLTVMAFRPAESPKAATIATELKWYTIEEAAVLCKTAPRKLMIDVYTEWCGWCKRMDKNTYTDPKVVEYINAHFYPVKFDAEQKAEVKFNNETFGYVTQEGGRGVHTFAYALLDGHLGYPSVVYLNEKNERIMISPGYKEPAGMMKELQFAAEEHYSKTTWEEYSKTH